MTNFMLNYRPREVSIPLDDCDLVLFRFGADIHEDNDEGPGDKIGHVSGTVLCGSHAMNLGLDIVDAADEINQDVFDLTACVFGTHHDWLEERVELSVQNVLLLDRIYLEQEWRGHGVGTFVIKAVLQHMGYGCDIVALHPQPIEKGNGKSDRDPAGLVAWYKTLGFRPLADTVYLYAQPHLVLHPLDQN